MYYIPKLLTNRNIRHGISTTEDGNLDYRYGEKEKGVNNRKKFFDKIKIPVERSVFMDVQHGTKIITATTSLAGTGFNSRETAIKADAMITTEKNLALVVLTADCIPAIFFDQEKQILGLAHLSRRNTQLQFAQMVISLLKREYGSNIPELKIHLGPSIKKESYILPEFKEGYDLVGENVNQLLLKGIREENIFIDPVDTAKNTDFFSHYRAGRTTEEEGRFATVAMLE